jgi:hypothetical protein
LAREFFKAFFKSGIRVGELFTQLGIPGKEHSGPETAAKELLKLAKEKK